MKIIKTKRSYGNEGMTDSGDTLDVSDARGKELIKAGLAVEDKGESKKKDEPKAKAKG